MPTDVSTRKVLDGSRTHFIEIKQNEKGYYLTLTELDRKGDRRRVLVGGRDARLYLQALGEAVDELDSLTDRKQGRRSYQPWSAAEDQRLKTEFEQGAPIAELAESHSRNEGAVRSRLKRLGLMPDE